MYKIIIVINTKRKFKKMYLNMLINNKSTNEYFFFYIFARQFIHIINIIFKIGIIIVIHN